MIYSFCESVHAGALSAWHIRVIPEGEAKKLGGGITTNSLCGRIARGWDLEVEFSRDHFKHTCARCVNVFYARKEDKP